MKKNFIQKIFLVLKLSDFCFEINSFFSWLLNQFHIAFTAADMWHQKYDSVLLYKRSSRIFRNQEFKR